MCGRMAGRASGRGSENHTRPRIRNAGALALTAVQDLERSMKLMRDLENVSPQKVAPKARKMIKAASKDLAAGLEGVKQGTHHLLRGSRLGYAVEKKAREMQNSGGMQGTSSERCNLIDAINACGVSSPCVGAESGQHSGTMLVADRYLELRPIDVGGVKVPRPVNGHKYQNTEAVQVLYHAVHRDGGTLKHIVHEMQRLTWIKGSHQCWGDKVRKVKAVVDATPGLADVAAIIQAKFSDHVSTDGSCKGGNDDIMSISEFEVAVRDLPPKEGGCALADCKKILLHAKQKKATLLAQDPASVSVSDKTVRNYMQLLGGENGLLVRRKVSKRSHARTQAQESEMHMWAFLVTTLMNHALPADDGIGEEPPKDDWGIWNAVKQHHKMPIRPVPPAQIINCDASTIGIRCNPDGANESEIIIVNSLDSEDNMSGNVRSYWRPGADVKNPHLFAKVYEHINADGQQADMMIVVSHLTEEQLPSSTCPEGLLAIPVEGFCIGAGQQQHKRMGYVVLMRGGTQYRQACDLWKLFLSHLVGCYLYYDVNLCRVVRSGKAYGREANIGTRIDAHAAGSRKGGSRFYRMYPDRDTHKSTGGAKVCGFHQDLEPWLGCAFDKTDPAAVKLLTTDVNEGGILRWSQQGLELASKCPHGDTLVEKQLHIVSYMFEVMADIMIEPKHNMSDSASFEMFLMGKTQK